MVFKNRKANTQMSNEYLNMYEIELSGKCENCLSFYHTPIRMDMIKKAHGPKC